jgi:predicted CXXCH cytochrome family protein
MQPASDFPTHAETPRRRRIWILAWVLAVLGLATTLICWRLVPAQRLSHTSAPLSSSPYQNTRLGVNYVGDAACLGCHAKKGASYGLHPMGRSLYPITPESAAAVAGSGGAVLFEAGGLQYSIENRNGHVFHLETRRSPSGQLVAQKEAEVQYVLGSGRQAVSYLVERDGFLVMSPINWFPRAQRWDLAPGYDKLNLHFNRPAAAECLFCHANQFNSVPGTVNRYQQPIFRGYAVGCERCHGPGELHVRRPAKVNGQDMTIVNPDSLEPALRDAVCEQCHLSGHQRILRRDRREEDYRPGLPFYEFWTVLNTAGGAAEKRFVGQVEQMHESRCFRESKGALGCTSCHDPHRLPEPSEQVAYYRQRCLQCHADQGCSLATAVRLQRSRDDDCVSCHMPSARSSDVIHVAITDHRIPRLAAQPDRAPAADSQPSGGQGHVVLFHRDLMNEQERAEAQRDVGVGLAMCDDWPPSAAAALPLLEAALLGRPDDVAAWESKGIVLGRLGRREESMAAFRAALAQEPNREQTLMHAAYQAVFAGRREEAIAYWRRLIAINPGREIYHAELANLLSQVRDWRGAADESRAAIRLNPARVQMRQLLVRCELYLKNPEAARKEFQTLLGFDPPNRDELVRWFAPLAPDRGGGP